MDSKVAPYLLAYSLSTGELKILGLIEDKDNEDNIAVFVEEINEFDKNEDDWHPYFNKSYDISIARIHDFEPAETDLIISEGDLSMFGIDVNVPKEVLKKIVYHAKMLVDAIDELLSYVPLDKLPKEEDVYGKE